MKSAMASVSFLVALSALMALLAAQHAGHGVHSGRTLSAASASELPGIEAGGALPGSAIDPAARQAGADEGWWETVTAQLARTEYRATANPEGLQAPNRAHNLRTYFRERGIEIVPREGDTSTAWRFAWETVRFGRPGALHAVGAASPEPDGPRVTYRHPEFDEWYENSRDGLEQGFTVHARPAGRRPAVPCGAARGPAPRRAAGEGGSGGSPRRARGEGAPLRRAARLGRRR